MNIMKNWIFRLLLIGACTVAGGTLMFLIFQTDLNIKLKVSYILLIISMILVSLGLILNQKQKNR